MKKKLSDFEEFKKIALRPTETILSLFTITPISIRVAYLIKKLNLNISPNNVTLTGLFFLYPLMIILLLLAPIFEIRSFYLVVAILFYSVLFVDWIDGQLARGLGKSSEKGAFLDIISDRVAIIVFFVTICSIGIWTNNLFVLAGGIFLFVIKMFHIMVITKIYYFKEYYSKINPSKGKNKKQKIVATVFTGTPALNKMGVLKINTLYKKINSVLKIKRWQEKTGPSEQYFLTIMVPTLLVFFNFETIAIYLLYFYIFAFSFFFLFRIKNMMKEYVIDFNI